MVKCNFLAVAAQRRRPPACSPFCLQIVNDGEYRAHRYAVDGDDLVIELNAGLCGRHVRFELGYESRSVPAAIPRCRSCRRPPPRAASVFPGRSCRAGRQSDRLLAADHHLQQHVFPGGILRAVDANDAIALLDAGLGGGGVVEHPADYGRLVERDCGRS